MKRIIILIAIIIAPIVSFGQSLFDKYEDMDGVTSGAVTQKMFSLLTRFELDLDNPEEQAVFEAVKKIESVKMLVTGDERISTQMGADVKRYIGSSQLDELMRFKDGGQTVKFYIKEGRNENFVEELLMHVSGLKELTQGQNININGKNREVETVLVTITGDIDLREFSKIAELMNVPGSEQLKKVRKQ